MRQLNDNEMNALYKRYTVVYDMVHPLEAAIVTILALSPIMMLVGAL